MTAQKSRLEQDERSYFDKPVDLNHRQATQLLNAVMSYARLILRRYGQLAPFGFGIDREGQVGRETLEIPRLPRDPARLWKLLGEHMATRVRRGQLMGVAMAANVTLGEKSAEGYGDAVVVTIELESGYATEVTVPYRIYGGQLHNLLPRRIVVGKAEAEESASRLFGAGRAEK
ncbi:MAG TPA: hypothetical protein VHX37_06330 [Acidobacteriaceae bacterium]|jgi:hypothetical protein|nr:hypothetical protein [Acidobacteriaceae bacterium]